MKVDFSKEDMVLKVYPTIAGCFQEGWLILKNNFSLLLLAVFFAALIDIPMGYDHIFDQNDGAISFGNTFLGLFGFAYYMLIVTPVNYGVDWTFLQAARRNKPQFEELLFGFRKFLLVVLSHLLVIGIVGLGFLFFIIPGIYLACKLIFVPYLVMDKNVDPLQAIKLSYYLSKGYFWTIFGMGILSFLIFILGLICMIVGVFVSIIWISSSFAVLYKALEELHFENACQLASL
ncbi:hypothetical protein ACT3CE_09385 [Marinifilum sp. RC60d5]|uniref:hypothetical protein n=1 Tax=Marinifilum sp. RC60d5 TaxID=3458414 RepID=UPI00403698AD